MNPSDTLKTLIVDDHAVFRAGLIKLLEARPDIQVIGELDSGENLMKFLETTPVDLIILDISLPNINGIKLLEQLKKKKNKAKVIVLSMYKVAEYCRLALKHGAMGYVLKEDAFDQVANAIDAAKRGEIYISPRIQSAAVDSFLSEEANTMLPEVLTRTERVVLQHIAEGMSNKEVAKTLDISVRTVETHRAHILRKLKIKNTAGLVQYAIKNKMIRLNHLEA